MCRFIWEWIYAKRIEPQDTRWHFWGVLGGHKSKSLGRLSNDWTDWHQIWYTSADSSGNGHRLNTIRPSTWGVRGSQIQKSGEDVERLVRLASNLVHMCRFIWEWIYAKQISLRDTGGTWGGLGGQTFKSQGKLSNGWTDWHQLWFTSADSSGNGHMLNTSRPSIPQGACRGGGVRGSHIQTAGEAVKRLDRLAPNLVHVCGFIWEWTESQTISPTISQGGIVGGFNGSTIQKTGKLWSNGWADWESILHI